MNTSYARPKLKPKKPSNHTLLILSLLILFLIIFIFYHEITIFILPPRSIFSLSSKLPQCDRKRVEMFLWYAPHSGFNNQLSEFKNAVLMAAILNGNLVVPPLFSIIMLLLLAVAQNFGFLNLIRFAFRMSQLYVDDADDMVEGYEIEDIDDDMDEDFRDREMVGSDSDVDEDDFMENKFADTSSAQARRGRDIQGIPWNRLSITRDKYRQTRIEQYKNYENVPNSGERAEKVCKKTRRTGLYYDFRHNSRSVKSTILHFQLRNLVWATSKHDAYLMSNSCIIHWSSLARRKSVVLNVAGHVAPTEKHPGSLLEGFSQTQVSTLAVKDNLLVAGGFQGELICKNLDRSGVSFCSRTTYDDNAITNAVEIYASPSGAIHFTASNNDCGVRDFDMEKFQLSKQFQYPWPVNHTSLSPDSNMLVIVGDNSEGLLVDSRDGKIIQRLIGHLDFSFASAWNTDGVTFATGNQDKTCRIWDARNLSKSVAVLRGNLGAIRSIRYTSDGRFMAMAEPADFVHVFDVKNLYEEEQEIDFFGEVSGISYSPDTESLFIGVWDRTYGSLLEYNRRRNYSYMDCLT